MEIILEEGKIIDGYNKKIMVWNMYIAIKDISNYKPESKILVNVKMVISNQPFIIEITQYVNYEDIIKDTLNLLPLKGELFLVGSNDETKLIKYEANVFYVKKL